MPGKPQSRKWNDVQTAIATAAIVTTLGLWNLFATHPKVKPVQTSEPVQPPPTEPPVEAAAPTAMPYVKIFFTPGATSTTNIQQQVPVVQQTTPKKKKRNNNNNSGGSVSVTQTKSS